MEVETDIFSYIVTYI